MLGNLGAGELAIIFGVMVVWLLVLIDILRSNFANSNKIVWILAIILLPFIGIVLYMIIGRKQKISR